MNDNKVPDVVPAEEKTVREKTPYYKRLEKKELGKLNNKQRYLEQKLASLFEKRTHLDTLLLEFDSKTQQLSNELNELYQKESDEVKVLKKEISELKDKILEASRNEQANIAAAVESGDAKNPVKLRNEIAYLKNENNEFDSLVLSYKKMSKEESKIEREIKKLETSINNTKEKLETVPDDNYLKNELERLTTAKEDAEKRFEDIRKAEEEEIKVLSEKKAQNEKYIEQLKSELEELGSPDVGVADIFGQSNVISLREKLAENEAKLKSVDSKIREQAKTDAELSEYLTGLDSKQKEYDQLQKALADTKTAIAENEKSVTGTKEKLTALNRKIQSENYRLVASETNKDYSQSIDDGTKLLVVKNLKKFFAIEKGLFGNPTRYLRAVDDVSFSVAKGRTMGIVGESGCGKTTMGRAILRLHDITDGEVIFNGHHIESISNKEMRSLRTQMQIIFQDPYSSLSPRLPIGEIIGEAVRTHNLVPKSDYRDYIVSIMKQCGLQSHYFSRYPHEFSGGQRQRICIARALALNPQLVICDEPVSALDVSIQAQIINLLEDLQSAKGLTYLFISHDLSVVEHISDDVGVMYLGSLVECGDKNAIFDNPMHPYTEALFSAVPVPDPNVKMDRIMLKGDIPSPANPPSGCKFHTRCHKCMDICREVPPVFKEYEPNHMVACHRYPQD